MDWDELEKRLKSVPEPLAAAFAVRCAMRLLPLLAPKKIRSTPFYYWNERFRVEHILAILRVLHLSVAAVCSGSRDEVSITYRVARAVGTAASEANAYARVNPDATLETAYIAATVTDAIRCAAIASTELVIGRDLIGSAATAASTRAFYEFKGIYSRELEKDLKTISQSEGVNTASFLSSPLWERGHSNELPHPIVPHWLELKYWLKSLNSGFDVWIDWYEERLKGKSIDSELMIKAVNIPEFVYEQGPAVYNDALKKIFDSTSRARPINLVRAIFIGNGYVGKTSLIRRLYGEKIIEGQEKMTPGIEIREWQVEGSNVLARIWDFGGQVIGHAMHQFFLREDCVYVLVIAGRTDYNINEEIEYWLEHVRAFGKNASVMIVGNKNDEIPANPNMGTLREKYPNIVGFYPLSCIATDSNHLRLFENFKNDLNLQLIKSKIKNVLFYENEFSVVSRLRLVSLEKALIMQEEFDSLCKEENVGESIGLAKEDLLGLLDKLGEVVHFPKLEYLGQYVLNPRWLTYGVYTLLYSKEIDIPPQGELTEEQVYDILTSQEVYSDNVLLNYCRENCNFIIQAMEEFKLCYRLPHNRRRIIIPSKLKSDQPENLQFDRSRGDTLKFEFEFRGFLPRYVMPTFIAIHHEKIKEGLVWQNGAVFHLDERNALARVDVDYHDRVMTIWVQGDEKDAKNSEVKEVLELFRDDVKTILSRMEDLDYEEMITLPAEAEEIDSEDMSNALISNQQDRVPYKQLIAVAKDGQKYFISVTGRKYNVAKALGILMSEEKQKEQNITLNFEIVNVANALSPKDLNRFLEALTQLIGDIVNVDGDKQKKNEAVIELNQLYALTLKRGSLTYEEAKNVKEVLEKFEKKSASLFRFVDIAKKYEGNINWLVKTIRGLFGEPG